MFRTAKIAAAVAVIALSVSACESTAPVKSVDGASTPVKTTAPKSSQTTSQGSAVQSAKTYVSMGGFSRTGLIHQLEFEKFSTADATYGADNSGANWTKAADESAATYMEMGGFSAGSLLTQLKFEGFTAAQAAHGVASAGL